jgi:hypothetical protein
MNKEIEGTDVAVGAVGSEGERRSSSCPWRGTRGRSEHLGCIRVG